MSSETHQNEIKQIEVGNGPFEKIYITFCLVLGLSLQFLQ